jgi:hypothetical protein
MFSGAQTFGNYTKSSFSEIFSLGNDAELVNPYISGYYYLMFTRLPEFLDETFPNIVRVNNNSVTFPDITLNTTEIVTGFGGAGKINVPTTIDKGTDFSVKFLEQEHLPIINSFALWVQNIRDYNTGLSAVSDYNLKNISGEVLVVLTKPVMTEAENVNPLEIIQKSFYFTEVLPTNVPFSTLNQDITNSDKVEPEITFRYTGLYHGSKVDEYAATKISDISVRHAFKLPNELGG